MVKIATYTAQYAEDAAHTTGDLGTQILTVRKDSAAALAGADGDYQPPVTDASGRLWVNASGAAVPVTDNAGSLTVDGTVAVSGTVAVTQSGTWDEVGINDSGNSITVDGTVTVGAITAGDNNIGNVDIVTMPGTGVEDAAETAGGTLHMVGAVRRDTAASSSGTTGDNSTINTDANGLLWTNAQGQAAHDAAVSGNPNRIAGKSLAYGSAVTAVSAAGDQTDILTDMGGVLYVNTHQPNSWNARADYSSAQTNASLKTAPGAGLSLYITDVIISNGATAGNISLLDGSGGTTVLKIYPAINGGAVANMRTPIKLTANTALCVTSVTCTTHSVAVSGFIAA